MRRTAWLAISAAILAAFSMAAPAAGAETGPASPPKRPEFLPDLSEGLTGRLGPFLWSRAMDMGGDARFCDDEGRPDPDGRFLWLYQFMRLPRDRIPHHIRHERNNLVSIDREVAYDVQPWRLLVNCPGPHTFKLVFGYLGGPWRFQHGDNCDLAHLAGADRVCVFLPIRPERVSGAGRMLDQTRYPVNTLRAVQSVCVIEFRAGEMIHYEWFRRDRLHERILLDLAPHFSGEKALYPGITKPIFRFTVDGRGGWTLRVERDGRDGLAGGRRDGDWDLTFTHTSPGAKPYTVDVKTEASAWAFSTFSPGGKPEESSEAVVGLAPFDRATGEAVPWPDRSTRIRTFRVDDLDRVLAGKKPGPRRRRRPKARAATTGQEAKATP